MLRQERLEKTDGSKVAASAAVDAAARRNLRMWGIIAEEGVRSQNSGVRIQESECARDAQRKAHFVPMTKVLPSRSLKMQNVPQGCFVGSAVNSTPFSFRSR